MLGMDKLIAFEIQVLTFIAQFSLIGTSIAFMVKMLFHVS